MKKIPQAAWRSTDLGHAISTEAGAPGQAHQRPETESRVAGGPAGSFKISSTVYSFRFYYSEVWQLGEPLNVWQASYFYFTSALYMRYSTKKHFSHTHSVWIDL